MYILFLYNVYISANCKKRIQKFIVLSMSVFRCKGDNSYIYYRKQKYNFRFKLRMAKTSIGITIIRHFNWSSTKLCVTFCPLGNVSSLIGPKLLSDGRTIWASSSPLTTRCVEFVLGRNRIVYDCKVGEFVNCLEPHRWRNGLKFGRSWDRAPVGSNQRI